MKQPKLEIGDRVTYASPELPYQKSRGIGEVVGETADHYYIIWADNPKMECPHLKAVLFDPSNELVKVSQSSKVDILPEIAKPKVKKPKAKPSLPLGIKIGDNVRNLESGTVGTVTDLSDRCITVRGETAIESHNLTLGIPKLEIMEAPKIDILPEIAAPDLHGYFEHYQPVIKGVKSYWYRRYVYASISGRLVHYHVPSKMVESIETLWQSGATAKEICIALGKSSK